MPVPKKLEVYAAYSDPKLSSLQGLTVAQIIGKRISSNSNKEKTEVVKENCKKIRNWSADAIADSLEKKGHLDFAQIIKKNVRT